ncbi:hypothetical protein FHX49_000491 [Microbacterium endophyticum]|uniref:Uncharacterized protein n=1 Tax=Microbacterium endophyticum TaxID=1526412 RepID=A0A7W4YL05_9MICO|nr:DUF6572 domain-containing protein [Microbacterium endophyticum]MBB2974950.1 hypothetical protein [Microbacterium endophyticum]NIK37247.1 hypothetical protein [Microbacterium endophyticum]
MSGIADTNTIDLVAQDADGTYLLVMVESRPWGSDAAQATQLQNKINTYAGYALDGLLAEHYPETVGQPVAIRLHCVDTPTGEFADIAAQAADQLATYAIAFRVNPENSPESAHETPR